MPPSSAHTFRDFVLDQLGPNPAVESRRLFGGFGLYRDDRIFGIIHRGKLYFRTSEETRPDYEKAGMSFFQPNEKNALKSYYEVPPAVLDDPAALRRWAAAPCAPASPSNQPQS